MRFGVRLRPVYVDRWQGASIVWSYVRSVRPRVFRSLVCLPRPSVRYVQTYGADYIATETLEWESRSAARLSSILWAAYFTECRAR